MLVEFTGLSPLEELAARVSRAEFPVIEHWVDVGEWFREWAARPHLRKELRSYIDQLTPQQATWVIAHSRETTTHFAWCLRDEPDEPFTFWLHEYKPLRDWRTGYADSVHNHRYHFCTTILSGAYLHERFDALLGIGGRTVISTELTEAHPVRRGHHRDDARARVPPHPTRGGRDDDVPGQVTCCHAVEPLVTTPTPGPVTGTCRWRNGWRT